MRCKVQWLDRALLVSTHHYTLCTTPKLFRKAMKSIGIPKKHYPDFMKNWHSNATAHYFENMKEGKMCVIVTIRAYEDKTPAQVMALIVHESVHIWQQVRQALGETNPADEQEAYAIQNISQCLLEEFYRQTAC